MSIEIERAQAITWIRIQMAQHGLSLADLQAAGCFAEPPTAPSPGAVRYRNAHGQGWDGRGAMPDWLQRAIHAGQTVEHFRVPIAGVTGRAVKGSSENERLASGAVCATAQWVRIGTRSYAVRYNGTRHLQTANELFPVKKPDLQAKLAYCAKTRRSNYAASLRLEGYDVTPAESKRKLPSREAVLQTYRKPA